MRCVFLFLLFLAGSVRADDDQLANDILGTWTSSFDVPALNNSIVKERIVYRFTPDGHFQSDWATSSSADGATTRTVGQGTWRIDDGILTMQTSAWKMQINGQPVPPGFNYPPPAWDDGPSSLITFVNPGTMRIHGATFMRH